MFVTVLGRVAGIDAKDYTKVSFDDVVAGSWYAPYVAWASEEGLVLGYGDNRFGVEDQITIEQVVVLLSRYAEYIGIDITTDSVLYGFTDHDMVADWAFEQLKWATYHGIYTGFDGALKPQLPAERWMLAEMLLAFDMVYSNKQ